MKIGMTVFVLIAAFVTVVFAKEEIIWLHANFPPHEFTDKNHRGEGDCDCVMFKAHELLSQYDHTIRSISFPRFLKLIKNKPNYCYTCLLKNSEREAFIIYSKPYNFVANNMLITRAEDAKLYQPYLDLNGSIDLDKMMQSGKITLAIGYGRSYGTYIDAMLKPYRGTSSVHAFFNNESSSALTIRRLLTLKAYHATLNYSIEIMWHAKKLDIPKAQFKMYPIKGLELFDVNAYTYIGCSKSELGKKMIESINANINELRKLSIEKYRQFLDEDTRKLHELYEPTFFKNNP